MSVFRSTIRGSSAGVAVLGGVLFATACATVSPPLEDVECHAICDQVVDVCGLASWPSHESCLLGCIASGEAGADLQSHEACVSLAQCDLFAIVDCELDFGAPLVEE